MSRWWCQKSSAAAWWSHSYTRPYTRSFSKVDHRLPKGISTVLWLLGTDFKNTDENLGENVSQNCFQNCFPKLCSSSLLLQPLLHPTADAKLNPGCCGCHECPSISREWPWCPLTRLLFQPGHGAGWSPLRFISHEDTKYQCGCTGSNPPPITHVISLLFLCALLIHRLISALY